MIEHKLHVFISSKCGGRYSIARKALKALLESTGLVETYVFESEPASSQDTQSAYLDYVDESNLCLFLIDNKDGIPAAVLSEERRAKAKTLRLIYIFCDADEKRPTAMQEEIRSNLSQKYFVVHDFSDMVNEAYRSVMQDIIAIYKQKPIFETVEYHNERYQANDADVGSAMYSMPKSKVSQFASVNCAFTWVNSFNEEKETEQSKINIELANYLKFVLRSTPFCEEWFSELREEIISEQDPSLSELLKYRLEAQRLYNLEKYEKSIEQLKCAMEEAVNNSKIPNWLANDIAIDIRHIYNMIAELNSASFSENPGQKIIDSNAETVFYPLLDRHVENVYEEVSKQYFKKIHQSPYTVQIGGLESMFSSITTAFCVAEMYGSIVQTEITAERLIDVLAMLCSTGDDHDFGVELIRLLIIERKNKDLDNLLRDCPFYENTLSAADLERVLRSLDNIPHSHQRWMSKYFLASRFGYVMSDDTFGSLCRKLNGFSLKWVKDEKRIFNLNSYIFDFYRSVTHRVNKSLIIDFILNVFSIGLKRFYSDCFRILQILDYAEVSDEDQRKVLKLLCDIINNNIECTEFDRLQPTIIRFALSAKINIEELSTSLQTKKPSFYLTTYTLEMSRNSQDQIQHIQRYIAYAEERNKTQGLNGCYSGYADEPYDVIYNILSFDNVKIDSDNVKMIINSTIATLSAGRQIVSAKIAAVQLLIYLRTHYSDDAFWNNAIIEFEQNVDIFSNGVEMGFFDKTSRSSLQLSYKMLLSCFSDRYDIEIVEQIFSISQDDTYDIIKALQLICKYLDCHENIMIREVLLSAMTHFCVVMSTHKERDIKYFASKCLIALTHFPNNREFILMQLSKLMDSGTQNVKIAILTHVSKITADDSSYLAFILEKGNVDSNYLVRSIAERERKRLNGH